MRAVTMETRRLRRAAPTSPVEAVAMLAAKFLRTRALHSSFRKSLGTHGEAVVVRRSGPARSDPGEEEHAIPLEGQPVFGRLA
jgi:hypothetical protein